MTWTVVVPVKVTSQAKTRLAGDLSPTQRVELVRAMVVDTVAAARATPTVDRVVVVTDDPDVVADLTAEHRAVATAEHRAVSTAEHPAVATADQPATTSAENRASTSAQHPDGRAYLDLVPEPSPAAGLNAAIRAGVASARSGGSLAAVSVAVLLGDLPALRPGDLGAALEAASEHDRAVVADADGSGTTLLTARSGVELHPAFGPGSAVEHAARGHVVLDVADVPALSGLRQDVDLARDLAAVAALGPGPRTTEVLDRWERVGEGSSAA